MPLLTFTPFKFELANDLKGKDGAEGFSLGPISVKPVVDSSLLNRVFFVFLLPQKPTLKSQFNLK